MSDKDLLFQIKSLEKTIFRTFIQDDSPKKVKHKVMPTPTQIQIIQYMLKHPNEEIYQKDLEKVLNLRRATVSGVLQTMEKNELIERISDNNDARIKKIILHPNTKKVYNEKKEELKNVERIMLKNLTNEEITQFTLILNKMKTNIENYNSLRKEEVNDKINKRF